MQLVSESEVVEIDSDNVPFSHIIDYNSRDGFRTNMQNEYQNEEQKKFHLHLKEIKSMKIVDKELESEDENKKEKNKSQEYLDQEEINL